MEKDEAGSLKRCRNFLTSEKEVLVKLVKQKKNILECKKSDVNTNYQKIKVWDDLADQFNAESGINYRDGKTLRAKYTNMKKLTKKKFANEKSYARGTGGGPPKSDTTIDSIDTEIKDMLGVQVEGMESEFDNDTEYADDQATPPYVNDVELEEFTAEEQASNLISSKDWATYTPAQLRQPRSAQLMPLKYQHQINELSGKINPSCTRTATSGTSVDAETELTENTPKTVTLKNCQPSRKVPNYTTGTPCTGRNQVKKHTKTSKETWETLGQTKLEFVRLQSKLLQEEHDVKIKTHLEEHAMRMDLMNMWKNTISKHYPSDK